MPVNISVVVTGSEVGVRLNVRLGVRVGGTAGVEVDDRAAVGSGWVAAWVGEGVENAGICGLGCKVTGAAADPL